ncbi:hypothetical protein ACFW2E_20150, partial [Streptomyces sp. NPDC058964]
PAPRAPPPRAPAPAFGSQRWSPDIRQAFSDSLDTLEEETAVLKEAAGNNPREHLAELVEMHRRVTIRTALHWEKRSHCVPNPPRQVFDEGVALARRLADLAGPEEGRPALGRALTDRSMLLVAAGEYGEAHDDFVEATALLD